MPLKWNRGVNPYLFNYYGLLGVGPLMPFRKVAGVAQDICRRIDGGRPPQIAGQPLSTSQINEACAKLADARNRAAELLLVHPEFQHSEERLGQIVEQVRVRAVLPETREPLPLTSPLAVFDLLPEPGLEVASLPPWDSLGLVKAKDPEDRDLDIVFDL